MKTIVVIPVYQAMNELEKVSLQQAVRVFEQEPICLAAPRSLDVSEYLSYGSFLIERFDDYYFRNIATYSELLLDVSFYERFSVYDYLLIHQLDAFVFRDELSYFCSLGYDYIGAPWPLNRFSHRMSGSAVGNGGLSLRHVHHSLNVLKKYRERIQREWLPQAALIGEDIFFAWAALQEEADFTTAPVSVAKRFSLECDVHHVLRHLTVETLPFGIHKWYQMDLAVWRPYIERYGYHIDLEDPHIRWRTSRDAQLLRIFPWGVRRLMRSGSLERMQDAMQTALPLDRAIYLRGTGKVGKQLRAFLESMHVMIAGTLEQGDCLPDAEEIILIASTKYEDAIQKELVQAGRVHGRDFLKAMEFFEKFLRCYYRAS